MLVGKIEYEIQYTRAADKFFNKHENVSLQYEDAIRRIVTKDNESLVDLKKIKGTREVYYMIRLGDYRVIYTIINESIVAITAIVDSTRSDI